MEIIAFQLSYNNIHINTKELSYLSSIEPTEVLDVLGVWDLDVVHGA